MDRKEEKTVCSTSCHSKETGFFFLLSKLEKTFFKIRSFYCNSLKTCHRHQFSIQICLTHCIHLLKWCNNMWMAVAMRITTWLKSTMLGSFSRNSSIFSMPQSPNRSAKVPASKRWPHPRGLIALIPSTIEVTRTVSWVPHHVPFDLPTSLSPDSLH